ncbi:hypothetical protein MTP03_19730 [Tsukamurella sp. PLM1]|nr:hypothetical protein MTP03_19730 [Tsukamurella sp. PLM1]
MPHEQAAEHCDIGEPHVQPVPGDHVPAAPAVGTVEQRQGGEGHEHAEHAQDDRETLERGRARGVARVNVDRHRRRGAAQVLRQVGEHADHLGAHVARYAVRLVPPDGGGGTVGVDAYAELPAPGQLRSGDRVHERTPRAHRQCLGVDGDEQPGRARPVPGGGGVVAISTV